MWSDNTETVPTSAKISGETLKTNNVPAATRAEKETFKSYIVDSAILIRAKIVEKFFMNTIHMRN